MADSKQVRACGSLHGLLLLLLLFLLPPSTAVAERLRLAPTPSFVADVSIPNPRAERLRQVEGGRYDLLHDSQVRLEGATNIIYFRRAYQVTDRSGLEEAAQIDVDFDPSYEKFAVHHVRLIRNGQVLDLGSETEFETIRREADLKDGVWTGVRTAVLRLPDVKVGDIIDTAWSWAERPPLWPNHYFGGASLDWSVPVGLTRFRIDAPATKGLRIWRYRGAPAAEVRRAGGRTIYEWMSRDPAPVSNDEDAPDWYQPWQRVSLSTMANWSDVVRWAVPLYRGADALPPAMEGEARRILAAGGGEAVMAVKALRWVQDSIRYTSMSIGAGSFRPRNPETVVRQGWGDCKDKAQLLVALLRRLGIEAWPALTDTDSGRTLHQKNPSPVAFDHVIVQIVIGGRSYWVDPTNSHQGGTLDSLAPPPFRQALPIRPGQAKLERIALSRPAAPTADVTEHYRVDSKGLWIVVRSVYADREADRARSDFANSPITRKEADFLRFYARNYPGLRIHAPVQVSDDREANRFEIVESYFLPIQSLRPLLEKLPIEASTLSGVYTYPEGDRGAPLEFDHPTHRIHRIIFDTPGFTVSPLDEVHVRGTAFDYRLATDLDGERLTITFSLSSKRSLVGVEDFDRFRKEADEVANNNGWTLYIAEGSASGESWSTIFGILFALLAVLSLPGIVHAKSHMDDQPEGTCFYPVPLSKFLLLCFSSLGLYGLYWFWRNWRWVRSQGEDVQPFWRAFFSIFWLYPLFARANGQARPALPQWVGGAAAILYPVVAISEKILDLAKVHVFGSVLATIAPLAIIPVLVAVNRSNSAEAVTANAKFHWLAIATLVVGTPAAVIFMLGLV